MTDHRLQELANEVAEEVRQTFKDFAIERVKRVDSVLHITFRWPEPERLQVSINLHEHDSEEAVKAEIRRQLRNS